MSKIITADQAFLESSKNLKIKKDLYEEKINKQIKDSVKYIYGIIKSNISVGNMETTFELGVSYNLNSEFASVCNQKTEDVFRENGYKISIESSSDGNSSVVEVSWYKDNPKNAKVRRQQPKSK